MYGFRRFGKRTAQLDEEHSREIIKRGLDLGVNFYDTAIGYQSGTSEQYVGRALRDFAKRDDVVVATKRTIITIVNALLILSFVLTAFCGMSMSGYAVPFLYGMAKVSFARRMHLSMSHWSFVLMGLHLGLHVPAMTAKWKMANKAKWAVLALFCILAGIGLFLFMKNGMPDYLFFRVPFAFLDYEKAGGLVILENILMLLFWAFIGTQAALLCQNLHRKRS